MKWPYRKQFGASAKRMTKPSENRFGALVSAAIAFAGVVVSGASIWVAYVQKSKDIEIAARKDLRDFVIANQSLIFGDDRAKTERIRNVMRVTFSDDLLAEVFPRIQLTASSTTRDIFSSTVVQGRTFKGKIDTWGGPNDAGTSADEGLALIDSSEIAQFKKYFLPEQPPGTTGLTRRLDPKAYYIAARWNYRDTSRSFLKTNLVTVKNPKNGRTAQAQAVDWGPSPSTGLVASISPGLAEGLGLRVDDEAIIEIP